MANKPIYAQKGIISDEGISSLRSINASIVQHRYMMARLVSPTEFIKRHRHNRNIDHLEFPTSSVIKCKSPLPTV